MARGPGEVAELKWRAACPQERDLYRPPAAPTSHPRSATSSRLRKVGSLLLLCCAAVAGIGYWIWSQGAEQRAVAAMPVAERRLLYSRTLDSLRACHGRLDQDPFRELCAQQAALALSFPECGDECRALSRLPWSSARR